MGVRVASAEGGAAEARWYTRSLNGSRHSPLRLKVSVFVRTWAWFVAVSVMLRALPLPRLFAHLSSSRGSRRPAIPPAQLGRAIWRSLAIAGYRPRCLTAALILYRLLDEQGQAAELVIGLPRDPHDKRAHAWVEVDGIDVGPPPGRHGHEELARYRSRPLGAFGVRQ